MGDVLGSPWERQGGARALAKDPSVFTGFVDSTTSNFNHYQKITKTTVVGEWSDDTEFTIALADSIIEKGYWERENTIKHYLDCGNSCPFLGKNTRALFHGVKTLRGYESRFNREPIVSESNGFLMRASPLSIFNEFQPDFALTNPECKRPAKIYYSILRNALKGTHSSFNLPVEILPSTPKGWCWIPLSLYLQCQKEKYQEAIEWIILQGGDTDTNGCVVGAIYGAVEGFDNLMENEKTESNWQKILDCDTTLGDYSRPDRFHPKRLIEISKDLSRLCRIFCPLGIPNF